ncbi:MAG: RecX family transcriptional regulator [Liquorilactobacillus hordei]|nr:RecX family transcriptional regulator [Liquorilactobacillus hordei]AUJ30900.1 recombinase RecX [Liquorilactobacillus hordei]MBZ2405586.1 recombinase RecX [Liquorilactobacillus hordei]QYH53187.1 recombination regulator RecX [Liquorilactobacillus hordei DSM 19519]
MPKILTKIQAQKKPGRFNLFIDGKYSFAVSETVLVENHLYKGQELSDEEINQLINSEEFSKLYQKALNYLSYQLRSEQELDKHLKEISDNSFLIEKVKKKLRAYNLLDDTKYASSYVRTMVNTSDKGFNIIRNNLRAKGIPENDIEQAKLDYDHSNISDKLESLIPKVIHQYRNQPSRIRIQKVKQRLIAKGFSPDEFENILSTSFSSNPAHEDELLSNQLEKLWNRYSTSNLTDSQKKLKIKQTLYRKGFALDKITNKLDEL